MEDRHFWEILTIGLHKNSGRETDSSCLKTATWLFFSYANFVTRNNTIKVMAWHNAIRQAGYYIINGHSMVSHIIAKCVICRKLRVCTQNQIGRSTSRVCHTSSSIHLYWDGCIWSLLQQRRMKRTKTMGYVIHLPCFTHYTPRDP